MSFAYTYDLRESFRSGISARLPHSRLSMACLRSTGASPGAFSDSNPSIFDSSLYVKQLLVYICRRRSCFRTCPCCSTSAHQPRGDKANTSVFLLLRAHVSSDSSRGTLGFLVNQRSEVLLSCKRTAGLPRTAVIPPAERTHLFRGREGWKGIRRELKLPLLQLSWVVFTLIHPHPPKRDYPNPSSNDVVL